MADWFQATAASGSLLLAIPVALIAGLVSFFSPCVIPLLPGYLSYATGLSGAELAEVAAGEGNARRGRMLAGSLLFVLGFTLVFVAFGSLSGGLGGWLWQWRRELTIGLGIMTILLGLIFAGVIPLGQREFRIHAVPAVGLGAAPLLGLLFGLGWMPCTGPTLGAITTLAMNEATPGRGAFLSLIYSLGLGLPFIVAALAYRRMLGIFARVRKHQQLITRLGGLMLVLVGVLLVTGAWDYAVTWLQGNLIFGAETVL